MGYDTRQRHAPRNNSHTPLTTPATTTTPIDKDDLPDFPPHDIVLHPDDASNKVLAAIARVLLAVNNCAMTIKDLAETCLVLGLLCHNVSAASQAITHWLRCHQKRCRDEGDKPLVLKHVLTGTRLDDAVAPALHSLSGGATPGDKGGVDRPAPGDPPRETHFRRGTVVWYLSSAAGAPCPFARAGIEPPSPDPDCMPRKRKRPPSAHVPGPQPQRPKLVLRLKPLARPQESSTRAGSDPQDDNSDSDDSASDAASNSSVMQIDTPFSPFPPSSSISIPLYTPDPDLDARRRYRDDMYDSDAPLPPDSEDEDDDYHNSMMRPPAFDFETTTTSPATTAEPCTPAVKQELSPPVTIVKAEFDSDPDPTILFQGWGAPSLEAKHEDSVIRILPSDWVSPPDVIDLVTEPWRFPSVSTDASEDFDYDICVKEEEVIAKLEPADDLPLSYRSSVSRENEADDDVWQPGAIPDDVVEEVSRRLALASFSFDDVPSLDPVAAEDFDGAWGVDQEQRSPAVRRATVPCLPSNVVPACRPARAASMSSLPRRVVLRTCRPFCPAIMATFIDGIPVYQTFLDAHRLLRRMDSDFVNITPLMRFLQLRVDFAEEPRCVLVRDGRDGVPGIWAPMEFALRVALSRTIIPGVVSPRLPQDILQVFLREGLEAHFPPPLPEVREGNMDWFGDPFGEDGEGVRFEDVREELTSVSAVKDLTNLTLVPLAPLPAPSPELPPSVPVPEAKGAVDLMAVLDPMRVDDPPATEKLSPAPEAAAPRRTLRKHSQLAKLAIASIAERDAEDSSSSSSEDERDEDEDEESDLTEPEPEPEDEKENAAPVEPQPAKQPPPSKAKAKSKASAPKTKVMPAPPTPTNATGPRTRRQTEEAAAADQRTLRRSTRAGGNNLGALALAVGASRKRGATAKGK
ncbi:hypothetical protein EXIGLDRAFT_770833 [Exidia glandulosa HHB12029]|uniref:HTH APSES-type domain-containing protein n=1 Tax=Exidia glandulosa HHB12029 TaxID=1314781 RepID=A0A165GEU4_EXIGL|nr:hypothetical protein EXIGLDRAFT_770833 [Exidia glandulosa HHB12029]